MHRSFRFFLSRNANRPPRPRTRGGWVCRFASPPTAPTPPRPFSASSPPSVYPLPPLSSSFFRSVRSPPLSLFSLEDYLGELSALGGKRLPDPRLARRRRADGNGGEEDDGNDGDGSSSSGAAAAPNFARAALILQNSSCVYGRKVEYLHGLVYTALNDLVSSARSGGFGLGSKSGEGGGRDKRRRGGGMAEAIWEELNAYDPDVRFLLLDGALSTDDTPGRGKIDLPPEVADFGNANTSFSGGALMSAGERDSLGTPGGWRSLPAPASRELTPRPRWTGARS